MGLLFWSFYFTTYLKAEIAEYLNYKYERISTLYEREDKAIFLLRDRETGEYCRCKRISRIVEIYKKLEKLKSIYLPEIYYLHYDGNETLVIEEEIQGRTLQAFLDEGKILGKKEQEKIFLQLCSVLSLLHKNGIVHRDLKPSNIMISGGNVKLVDFDAARETKEDLLTDTVLLGTKGFAPPEQYGFSQTDSRSDIYALGVTMQLVTGKKGKYKKIIKKCVSFDPKDRYKNAESVKRAVILRKYRGLIAFLVITGLLLWFGVDSYYNDPVFRDDVLLLLRDGGFITLSQEDENRIFGRKNYDTKEIGDLWCGVYESSDGSQLEITQKKDGLEFTLITYENGLKTSLVGGDLTIEGKDCAKFVKTTDKGDYILDMYIYENGVFVSENGVSSPYGHGQKLMGHYKKTE